MRRPVILAMVGVGAVLGANPFGVVLASSPWLHVRVEETKGGKVSVNLPLSVVEVALKAAPETVVRDDHFQLGLKGRDLKVSDIRKMWQELKKTPDVDLVTAEDHDETVTVAKKGDLVLIRVEKAGGHEEVHVEIPTAVVDALFEGDTDTLNVRGALAQLQTRRGDIVRVNDKDNTVHVWIDEQ
jgi:hypothetical protein